MAVERATRRALTMARLIVSVGEIGNVDLIVDSGSPSSLRPIELSPALLAGLDSHKRQIFLNQWRLNLSRQNPPDPSGQDR